MNNFMLFDVAALVIFLSLFITMIFRGTIHGTANRLFFCELGFCTIACISRLLYYILMVLCNYSVLSWTVANLLFYVNTISRNFIYPQLVLYVFATIGVLQVYKKNYLFIITMEILVIIPLIILFTDLFTGSIYEINERLELIVFRAYSFDYICSGLLLLIGLVVVIKYRKFMDKKNVIMAVTLYCVNTILLFCEAVVLRSELEMFTLAITSYVIINTTLRPELQFNPNVRSGAASALYDLIKKNYLLDKKVSYIFIKVKNYKNIEMYIGQQKFNEFLNQIADFLNSLCKENNINSNSYYLEHCLFAVPCESFYSKKLDGICAAIEKRLKTDFKVGNFVVDADARICVVDTPDDISSNEQLNYFMKKFHYTLPEITKVVRLGEFKNTTEYKLKNNIEQIMEDALKNKAFEVFYHPIYGVKEEQFVAAEALVRLKDEYFGYIPPSYFIPVAERNRQMQQLGEIVFEKAFKFVASQEYKNLNLQYIEINLSVAQCSETGFAQKIIKLMDEYGVQPESIRFEITENAADFNPAVVEKNMTELIEHGISFALDDYGTGYSNIKKVLSLPVDVVKLDKTFVDEIDNEKLSIVITDTIDMLKSLNKVVLIEGIESKKAFDHFTRLKYKNSLACEYIQGYYFTRPLSERDFVEFINKN